MRTRTSFQARPLADRLMARVSADPVTGCWMWTGSPGKRRYGCISDETGKKMGVHRASYLVHVGPIAPGAHVCHRCDTPLCVNPAHLFLGTHADNMRDMAEKGRARPEALQTCKRGHPFTPENTVRHGREQRRRCLTCARERNKRNKQKQQERDPSRERERMARWRRENAEHFRSYRQAYCTRKRAEKAAAAA